MNLKKKASRSIAIALVGVSMITPVLNTVSAMEKNEQVANEITNTHKSSIEKMSNTSDIKDKKALDIYNKLLAKNAKTTKTPINNPSTKNLFVGDFEALRYLGDKNSNFDIVYNEGDENLQTIITLNEDTNSYSLMELDSESDNIIYMVNDQIYTMVYEDENINLYSENGNVLPLLITEYQDTPIVKPISSQSDEKETKVSYGKEHGPFKKTNKLLVDVLGAVGTISGVAATKVYSKILGTISVITGSISWIGNLAYATLWIKYYQAYATDGSSRVRQRDRYYRFNNYTSFVKERTWTFYSSRP